MKKRGNKFGKDFMDLNKKEKLDIFSIDDLTVKGLTSIKSFFITTLRNFYKRK